MHQKKIMFAALGLCSVALMSATPAVANDAREKQDYRSGENIYRVEIRNLKWLQILETGDSDGEGELHELIVQLSAHNPENSAQFDGIKYTGTQLYSLNNGGIVGGRRNMPIRVGQRLKLEQDQRQGNKTQMWVHAYSNPAEASYAEPYSGNGGPIKLSFDALELDCTGQRVCRRNNTGKVTISFKIPEFNTPPSNQCGPSNTFRLEPLDGELQVSGLPETFVSSHTTSNSWYLGTKHKTGGPRLQPFNIDICIARTWR